MVIPNHLKNDDKTLRFAATAGGLKKFGYLLSWDELVNDAMHIDVCVVGSVAVDERGFRIGKGKGFADMEIAIMNALGMIDGKTVFVTLVHDCQVFETLDESLFDPNTDVRLDWIVTPTRVIEIKRGWQRVDDDGKLPYKINWNKLDKARINKIPVLKYLYQNKSVIQ